MPSRDFRSLAALVQSVERKTPKHGYQPITLKTVRGDIQTRYYPSPKAKKGAIWVAGVGGGWGTPDDNLYPVMAEELAPEGIASLRVQYRNPSAVLDESAFDVLAGIGFLEQEGMNEFALTGHSFGGAVVIQAASLALSVKAVITIASQKFGTDPVSSLGPNCATLFIHGDADPVLPVTCSEQLYLQAKEPKELVILPGNGHNVEQSSEEVQHLVKDWILRYLC